jgi:hypothetical protein
MFAIEFAAYAAALWLGCYLLARRPLTAPLAFTGLGLVAYAAALAAVFSPACSPPQVWLRNARSGWTGRTARWSWRPHSAGASRSRRSRPRTGSGACA